MRRALHEFAPARQPDAPARRRSIDCSARPATPIDRSLSIPAVSTRHPGGHPRTTPVECLRRAAFEHTWFVKGPSGAHKDRKPHNRCQVRLSAAVPMRRPCAGNLNGNYSMALPSYGHLGNFAQEQHGRQPKSQHRALHDDGVAESKKKRLVPDTAPYRDHRFPIRRARVAHPGASKIACQTLDSLARALIEEGYLRG